MRGAWERAAEFAVIGIVGAVPSAAAGSWAAMIARTYGVHMGLDVAWGPDAPVLYVIFVEDLHLVRWETESVAEHGQQENRT